MDTRILSSVISALPVRASQPAPVLPKPEPVALPLPRPNTQSNVDAQIERAEQQRFETVHRAAQDIANIYVVSDKRFTIFKDATGEYITRYTDLPTGKVTYIPEPSLLRQNSRAPAAALRINA